MKKFWKELVSVVSNWQMNALTTIAVVFGIGLLGIAITSALIAANPEIGFDPGDKFRKEHIPAILGFVLVFGSAITKFVVDRRKDGTEVKSRALADAPISRGDKVVTFMDNIPPWVMYLFLGLFIVFFLALPEVFNVPSKGLEAIGGFSIVIAFGLAIWRYVFRGNSE